MFLSQMFDERIWWIIAKNVLMVPSLCLGTRVPMDWATAATSLVHVVTTLSALWHKDKHQLKRSNCHSYTFCSLLDIWLWRYFSSVLMDQLDILFLSVLSFPVSHPFSLSHSLCLHLCAIFLQLPRMSTCMYLTGLHGVSDDALWQKLWQVKKKRKHFFTNQPASFCCCGANAILSLKWMRILHIFDTVLLLVWTQRVYVCLSVWRLRGM